MKIIRSAEDWGKEIECNGCGAILQVIEKDIEVSFHKVVNPFPERDTYQQSAFYAKCPSCQNAVTLKGLLPREVIPRVLRKHHKKVPEDTLLI